MKQSLRIEADPREDFGKNASRRLRRNGRVPAVLYGGSAQPLPVIVDPRVISPVIHSESAHTSIFSIEVHGKEPGRAMLKDWQVDPIDGRLLHVDLVRITAQTRLHLKLPIHLTGEAKGVKVQGGILEFVLREVEVECLPDEIPQNIAVDVSELTIGHHVRVSDLQLGSSVKVVSEPAQVVVHVVALKAEEEKPVAETVEAAPAEPEVIRKGKTEEEGAEEEEGKKGKPSA
jgi:large subunit ribosomal protein L25